MTVYDIPGVRLDPLDVHGDERGHFVELGRESVHGRFRQANLSYTLAGALRGLHYHRLQTDVWFLLAGRVEVGLADLRSGAVGLHTAHLTLDADLPQALYIPPGVAHGYGALEDATLMYLVDQEFDGSDEYGIVWNDPSLNIEWELKTPVLSERDSTNGPLAWDEIGTF